MKNENCPNINMLRLKKAQEQAVKAINRFEETLKLDHKWCNEIDIDEVAELSIDHAAVLSILRDSAIYRFKSSIDTLCNYLKTYLDEKLAIVPEVLSPGNIIREAAKARVITEQEAESLLMMMKKRNLTSHMYNEELVEDVIKDFSDFLVVMHEVVQKII